MEKSLFRDLSQLRFSDALPSHLHGNVEDTGEPQAN